MRREPEPQALEPPRGPRVVERGGRGVIGGLQRQHSDQSDDDDPGHHYDDDQCRACAVTPSETIGPYPSLSDFVRSDIREGKPGLPVTLAITVVNVNNACAPVAGATVDIWQCDADGNYSQYGSERNLTYLRGIQTTDANGLATFITIYPGWYQGRATHIHVEVTVNGRSAKVTQIAFPEDITAQVYRTGVYASSGQNPTTNARDNVFSDGTSEELVTLVGDTTNGYTGAFRIGLTV